MLIFGLTDGMMTASKAEVNGPPARSLGKKGNNMNISEPEDRISQGGAPMDVIYGVMAGFSFVVYVVAIATHLITHP